MTTNSTQPGSGLSDAGQTPYLAPAGYTTPAEEAKKAGWRIALADFPLDRYPTDHADAELIALAREHVAAECLERDAQYAYDVREALAFAERGAYQDTDEAWRESVMQRHTAKAEALKDAADDHAKDIEARIAATPARTVVGIAIKLRISVHYLDLNADPGDEPDAPERMTRAAFASALTLASK